VRAADRVLGYGQRAMGVILMLADYLSFTEG
jgi:hypothetical protein